MTNKFKVGDKVVRVRAYSGEYDKFMVKGNTYTVSWCDGGDALLLIGDGELYDAAMFQLAEEKPKFANMKFRVASPEHSEEIQEALFAMGYVWSGENCPTLFTNPFDFVYTDTYGYIRYGTVPSDFNSNKGEEHTVKAVKSYKVVPVEAPKETITIDGKQYDKEAVLKRLAELEVLG